MTAEREPFLFRTRFNADDLLRSIVPEGEGKLSPPCPEHKSPPALKSNCFNLTLDDFTFGLLTLKTLEDFFSLSRLLESLLVDLDLKESLLLLDGEFAADFKVDILGLPEPLAEGCLGEVPWFFGLDIPGKVLCFGLLMI